MAGDYDFPERQQLEFTIGGKKYLAREAGAFAAKRYKLSMLSSAKMEKGEPTGVDAKAFIEKDYQLLADCCIDTTSSKTVLVEEVYGWPEKACVKLIQWVKQASDLDQTGGADGIKKQIAVLQAQLAKVEGKDTPEERAKNELPAGESSSLSPSSSASSSTKS